MKKSKAFSLFEISIVTVVIAVLMAGVLQSRNIVKKAKLNNARALTVSSPVKSIDDIVAWFEPTLEKSFTKDEGVDGNKISTWYDINPNITTTANNANQSTSINRPTYTESAINGIPAIRFNSSSSNYLLFDGTSLANSPYTVFIVEQRRASNSDNFIIAGSNTPDNTNLTIGYSTDTKLMMAYRNNGYYANISGYSNIIPRIHSVVFNFSARKYYVNGAELTLIPYGAYPSQSSPTQAFDDAALGRITILGTSSYYEGDIGEVIIFKKALTSEERKSVEQYLSKKWNIDLN
ncbi:MAG: hypothetical protein FJ368_00080 [Pelagibacterales bacterium]|nr:hypothetical protein [Pelagibacterales bacterium]